MECYLFIIKKPYKRVLIHSEYLQISTMILSEIVKHVSKSIGFFSYMPDIPTKKWMKSFTKIWNDHACTIPSLFSILNSLTDMSKDYDRIECIFLKNEKNEFYSRWIEFILKCYNIYLCLYEVFKVYWDLINIL